MGRKDNLLTILMRSCVSFHLILSIGIGRNALTAVLAKVACNETSTCETLLRPGSTCTDGYCTNPFVKGCLNHMLGEDKYPKIRTCNSDDGPNALEHGLCASSPLSYEEIRVGPNNWESAMFFGWILQILLSEVLDVPSTVDTGPGGGGLSFYDPENSFAYPTKANNFDSLYKANEVGDCRESEESCAHFLPEMWQGKRVLNESAVEREGNGMVGHVGWFIPKFAAQEDASLTHYLGLTAEENRQKLADTFKRPLTWLDYCTEVSENNCTNSTNDDVATRAPENEAEGLKYFLEGVYTGHFMANAKNNCTQANPNCTGHMIDYPCTWSAYTASQLYWNDIFLESDTPDGTNSYKYGAMLEIIAASNATRSPIVITWWYPDPTMDNYDFVKVSLPDTSRECLENRPEAKPDRCDATREVLLGKKVGSCGYNTHTLEKYFARSFRERSVETPIAVRSPGHQLVRNTQISDIDITEMMVQWSNRGVDKWGYDPREAVCSWVADNFYDGLKLKHFLPPGYPRQVQEEAGYHHGFMYFGIAFGAIGSMVAVAVGAGSYRFRKEKQIKFAQPVFLYLFSLGFFLVCIGGILYGLVPSVGTCAARWWFVVIGFTFALLPLLIKVAAINKLMNDAKKMRRTTVSIEFVYKLVAAVVFFVLVYLSVWTGVDPSLPKSELLIRTEGGDIVDVHIECASQHMAWAIVAFCWEGTLICFSAAVAFQSRNIPQAFNESRVVGNMSYAFFIFLAFRLLIFFMPTSVLQPSAKNGITSLLLTVESLAAISLYFGPKFLSIYRGEDDSERGARSIVSSGVSMLTSKVDPICPMCGGLKKEGKHQKEARDKPKIITHAKTEDLSRLESTEIDYTERSENQKSSTEFVDVEKNSAVDYNENDADVEEIPSKAVEPNCTSLEADDAENSVEFDGVKTCDEDEGFNDFQQFLKSPSEVAPQMDTNEEKPSNKE